MKTVQAEQKQTQNQLAKAEKQTNEISFMKSKLNNTNEVSREYDKVCKKLNYEKEKGKTLQEQLFAVKHELEMQKLNKSQNVPEDAFELKSKFIESEAKNKLLLKDIIALKAQVHNQANSLYQYEFQNPI